MFSRARAKRVTIRLAAFAVVACGGEPSLPPVRRLGAFECGNADCTALGAKLPGLPPQTGQFMVAAWFKGTQSVHWSIRWPGDSVKADFMNVQDSSIVAAQLDGMPLPGTLVLTFQLFAGGSDSLTWEFH